MKQIDIAILIMFIANYIKLLLFLLKIIPVKKFGSVIYIAVNMNCSRVNQVCISKVQIFFFNLCVFEYFF